MEQKNIQIEDIEENIKYRGTIEPKLANKEYLKSLIIWLIIGFFWLLIGFGIIASIESENQINVPFTISILVLIIFFILILLSPYLTYIYFRKYIECFKYEFSEKFIRIYSGVFTKSKVTIPFSRIQNISINQGVFDRIYKLYTFKIETAGYSVAAGSSGASVKSEGYIPGIKDPSNLEKMINMLVHQYTQISPSLKGKIFENPDIAFDQFAAYFLEKIHGGSSVKNNLKKIREQRGLTQAELAEKIGVTRQTIYYLEAGKYLPSLKLGLLLAEALNVTINELFELEEEDRKLNKET